MNLVRGKTLGAKVGGGCCQATGVDFFYFLYGCQQALLCTGLIAFCPRTPSPPLAAAAHLYNNATTSCVQKGNCMQNWQNKLCEISQIKTSHWKHLF